VPQNILLGADATLDRFPVHRLHMDDGAKYANSCGIIVAGTPGPPVGQLAMSVSSSLHCSSASTAARTRTA
jgi:hypothetical protein